MTTPAVVVCGCGRSGTNVVLELLRGNPAFKATEPEEDKQVFLSQRKTDPGYLTKCDTVYFQQQQIMRKMSENRNLHLVWTIRDPRDMIMSKMRRGVPESEGGDCKKYASDSSVTGAIEDINRSLRMYMHIKGNFSSRVRMVRMEDVLVDTVKVAEGLCEWLGLKYYDDMIFFWKRMRNRHKAKRYKGIDKSQIAMWKNWKKYEGGWFPSHGLDLDVVFSNPDVIGVAKFFDYKDS